MIREPGSGEFGGFGFWVPVVGAAEEGNGQEGFGFGWGELVGPGDSGGRVGSGTGAIRFGVPGGALVGGAAPVVPAYGVHFGGEFGVDVDDAGVGAPGAAETDDVGALGTSGRGSAVGCGWRGGWGFEVGGDFAVEDDVAGGLVGIGAGLGGDEAGTVGVEGGAIEDGGGVAEDVVDAAFDVGVDVVLAAVVGEECVLMAEEAAVLEDGAVAAVGYGYGLAGVAGGVLEGDVVGLEAGSVDLDGFGEEGAAGYAGVERVSDDYVGG